MTNKLTNWQKFDKAFSKVSAYVVLDKESKDVIAKIALKYPKDGAGRLYCYMHVIGSEVQIGYASGYGYDKRTASICDASNKFDLSSANCKIKSKGIEFIQMLSTSLAQSGWEQAVNENYGFIVIQAV